MAGKMWEKLDKLNFAIIILDEAHYLKNPQAKRSENLVPICKKSKRVIIQTGTPAFARPRELFNIVAMIRPDIFDDFLPYAHRYCDPKMSHFARVMEYNGATCTNELHYLLKKNLMIRRQKAEVLDELPPKTRIKIIVNLD